MFTGIIKEVGKVASIRDQNGGKELTIECDLAAEVQIDQSISINGVCHTVVSYTGLDFTVQSVEETLRKTNIGQLKKGDPVNLERALSAGQLLDGHLVQGHTDTTGTIVRIKPEETDRLVSIQYPEAFKNLVTGRGSICVDGISLTVASLDASTFTVAVIPYTYDHTNLRDRREGDSVNLEFDILGKYVIRYLENRQHP